jgi:AIPR protein
MSSSPRISRTNESGTIELRIPPKDIKRLDDPHEDSRYAYECQVPVSEAAKLIIGSANPRKQDLGKSLTREILRTLQTEPELFHLRNRGIWVAAGRAEYDNQKQTLTLHCPQNSDQRWPSH